MRTRVWEALLGSGPGHRFCCRFVHNRPFREIAASLGNPCLFAAAGISQTGSRFPNRQQKLTVTRGQDASTRDRAHQAHQALTLAGPSTPSHASEQECLAGFPAPGVPRAGNFRSAAPLPVHSAVNVAWKDRTRHLVHYDRPGQRVEASTRSVLGNRCQFGKSLPVCSGRDFPNRQQIPKTAAETPRETFSCRG